jgi:hypothetical protein
VQVLILTLEKRIEMQMADILAQSGGLASMARDLGVSESQARAGAAALLPAVLGGFKKQATSQPGGLDALGGLLGQLGGGSLFDEVVAPQPTNVSRGDAVLGQIFGTKEVSRTVAQSASAKSGLDPAILKKMLPLLAMLVAGFMAKQGGQGTSQGSGGGTLGGILGGLLGGRGGSGGGIGSMLDLDGNGNPLDDILSMARGAKRT